MTVAKTLWEAICRPFEWALSLVRDPALLALWVLVPIAMIHLLAALIIEKPGLSLDLYHYIISFVNGLINESKQLG